MNILKQASILLIVLTTIGLAGCNTGDKSAENETSPPVTSNPPPVSDLKQGTVGCYAASFSQAAQSELGCGLISSFGDINFDQLFSQEIAIQNAFWTNIRAVVYAFDECAPERKNAYALPNDAILMGYWMIQDIVFRTGSNLPVAGVMAHEFGHQIQFQHGWMRNDQPTVRDTELEADMWSGFYMALAKGWTGTQLNSYFENLLSSGDYLFNARQHHGTPGQRLAAGSVGFDVGYQVGITGQRLSYVELHNIFVSEVNRIVSTVGESEEVAVGKSSPILSYEAKRVASGIDHNFADRLLDGSLSLENKDYDLSGIREQDRLSFGPY